MNWPIRLPAGVDVDPIRSRRSRASHVAKHLLAVRERWWQVVEARLVQAEVRVCARDLKREFDLRTGATVDHGAEMHPTLAAVLCGYHDENYAPAYGAALASPAKAFVVQPADEIGGDEASIRISTASGVVVVASGKGTHFSVRSAWRDPPGQTNRRAADDFSRAGVRKARWLAFALLETMDEVER